MHILLIDDEVQVIDKLAIYLNLNHHTVSSLTAATDEQSMHALLEEIQPDAAILDFGLVPAGDVIYRWIKAWNPRLKIVFYTNYADTAEPHLAMRKAGANENEIIEKREVGSDIMKILRELS